jgi:sugar phosphate isomerase/epimerase
MKIGIFTVSMPDYTPIEALKKAAELGYDGLEWRVTTDTGDRSKPSFWSGNRAGMTPDEVIGQADELKAKAAECKIEMPSLGTYIACDDLDAVDLNMRAAVALGAKSLRVGPLGHDWETPGDFKKRLAETQKQYAEVAKLAEKHGVRALIETHMNQLGCTVTKALRILDGLDPKHVGIMWDPGNQVYEGRELYHMAIEDAGAYLGEVHVKNARWVAGERGASGELAWTCEAAPLKDGQVNWPEVFGTLKRHGYEGWLFLEDFSTEAPLDQRLEENLKWLRSLDA